MMMGDEENLSAATGAVKKKRDERSRRRGQRSWENIMKSIATFSEGEKITFIEEKYKELYNEMRRTTNLVQAQEKQIITMHKDKEQLQSDLNKCMANKTKMENIARELQKRNKEIKEEITTVVQEGEKSCREMVAEKVNSLTALMDEKEEQNVSMSIKLAELNEQFQELEPHLLNVNRQLELQKQLSDTQMKKVQLEFQTEREIWERERQELQNNLEKCYETNNILKENIQSLRANLDVYKNKYADFENIMQRNTKLYDAFQDEMAKMQKANAAMEKDCNEWQAHWQACTQTILQMTELQQQTANEIKNYEKKVAMLEKLCRQLQIERAAYIQQLKDNNVVPVTPGQPEERLNMADIVTTSSVQPVENQKKFTKKEKELIALKNELKNLEDQIKRSTTAASTVQEKPKSKEELMVPQMIPVESNTCPETKILGTENGGSTATSEINIQEDLSTDAIPLHKSDAGTDLTQLLDTVCFAAEAPARTDLLEVVTSVSSMDTSDQASDQMELQSSSTDSIILTEKKGKTDVTEEL